MSDSEDFSDAMIESEEDEDFSDDDSEDEKPKKAKKQKTTPKKTKAKEPAKKETKSTKAKAAKEAPAKAATKTPAKPAATLKKEAPSVLPKTPMADLKSAPKNIPELPKNATESDIKNLITKYLNDVCLKYLFLFMQQNRPYTGLQIFENLHQAVPKTKLLQLLDKLTDEEVISRKSFNKTNIYYPKQSDATLSTEELNDMDSKIAEMSEQLKAEKETAKQYSSGI